MGQKLHGWPKATEATGRALPNSQESLRTLSAKYGINLKTVAKWKKRKIVSDALMGLKEVGSPVLSKEESTIVAFLKHTLLPLDDCLYALQETIPHITRSSLHKCFQPNGIRRLGNFHDTAGTKQPKKRFKSYPIGFFHIDITKLPTEEGKLHLFVAIDST